MKQNVVTIDRESFTKYSIEVRPWFYPERNWEDGSEWIRESFFLRAVNPYGYTRTYGGFGTEQQAMNAFEFELAPPVDEWSCGEPVYGSWAYQHEGTEEFCARREREDFEVGLVA